MRQRRARTGRTNAGGYLQLLPRVLLNELSDVDESGVERAPLTRAALEAAHLTELLGSRRLVRAGLPVAAATDGQLGAASLNGQSSGLDQEVGRVSGDSPVPEVFLTHLCLEVAAIERRSGRRLPRATDDLVAVFGASCSPRLSLDRH